MPIYDNSNIAESYAGTTTPLTFSFVAHVYTGVYTYFCQMMGVNRATIKKNEHVFNHMVECIGYNIYYNLSNWYTMLSLFPGYRLSARFMESMMGVQKEHRVTPIVTTSNAKKYLFILPKTLFSSVTIAFNFLCLGITVKRFNCYFDRIFSTLQNRDLRKLSLNELQTLYTTVNHDLLSRWRVPIANDFAVMVSTGLADMLFKRWLHSNDAYQFMRSTTHTPLATLDPSNRMMAIVRGIRNDTALLSVFSNNGNAEYIMQLLRGPYATHLLSRQIEQYLREFGARIPNELKLESETLNEHPAHLIALLQTMIRDDRSSPAPNHQPPRRELWGSLRISQKIFLRSVLRWANHSIRRREETRFRRTLIFGYVRRLFLAIGEKLEHNGTLKQSRDVLYLAVEEVFEHIGAPVGTNVSILIEERKQQQKLWEGVPLPRRIESEQHISEIENTLLAPNTTPTPSSAHQPLRGRVASQPDNTIACSGTAVTLLSFDPTTDFTDKILITRQTDPGWTIIFPSLKGLVVERGGMLSHAAIAARELNIPCIVGVENATRRIPSGTTITLDLLTGEIQPSHQ